MKVVMLINAQVLIIAKLPNFICKPRQSYNYLFVTQNLKILLWNL